MIGRPFPIARIFGILVKVDISWALIVVLLTASLTLAFFRSFPHLSWPARIGLALLCALLLFGAVLAHELSHALVALRHGIPIRGITLFIFGGAAEMGDEPHDAGTELRVALAGPAMSLALALGFGTLYVLAQGRISGPLTWVLGFMLEMNTILVAFNLVPGFPLDGGRVLRALLWSIWRDLPAATRVATTMGSGFGLLIMLVGFAGVFALHDAIVGLWFVFIGLFLRLVAGASYRQALLRDFLRGVRVRDLAVSDVITVSPHASLREVVHRAMLTSGLAELPVVEGTRLLGLIGLREIGRVDQDLWGHVTAGEVMQRDIDGRTVSPADNAVRVLSAARGEEDLVAVVEGETLSGVITLRGLMRHLQLRMELGARGSLAGAGQHGEQKDAHQEQGDQDGQQNESDHGQS